MLRKMTGSKRPVNISDGSEHYKKTLLPKIVWSIIKVCGRGSMVEPDLPKVVTRVRFPSPAPVRKKCKRIAF